MHLSLLLPELPRSTGPQTLAQLAVAWVLQNQNIAAAIIGASRPEHVIENVKASGVKLDDDVMKQIDDVVLGFAETDPRLTISPNPRA